MKWLAVVLVGLWAAVAGAEPQPARMFIWGGGKTREEAQTSLKQHEARAKEWDGVLALSEGYPRILESQTVAGLKPGFFVVVLGICEPGPETEKRLEAFKAFEPPVYARDVTWDAALACPRHGITWRVASSNAWKKKDGTLLAVELAPAVEPSDKGEQPADHRLRDALYRRLLVVLRAKDGRILDKVEAEGSGQTDSYVGHPGFTVELTGTWPVYYSVTYSSGCTAGPSFSYDRTELRSVNEKLQKREETLNSVDNSRNCDE
jgi:hypothetical protein